MGEDYCYIGEHIPSKLLDHKGITLDKDFECLFIEINLHGKKWLIVGIYNPSKLLLGKNDLILHIDRYVHKYDNLFIMGDFNSDPPEIEIYVFCSLYNLKNLVHDHTCYKNSINPTCIDLMLTNQMTYFQNTRTIETGLSDFHRMTVTVMKTSFKKHPAKVILYRDYKAFHSIPF